MKPRPSVCDGVRLSVCRQRSSRPSAPGAGSSCPGIKRQKEGPSERDPAIVGSGAAVRKGPHPHST